MIEKAIGIRIVDGRGRTVRRLSKRSYFDARMVHQSTERWAAEGKPVSRKRLARLEADVEHRPAPPGRIALPLEVGYFPSPSIDPSQLGRMALAPEGDYLPMPGGLPLRKDKVAAVLERVALALGLVDESGVVLVDDLNAATLTVTELRKYAH